MLIILLKEKWIQINVLVIMNLYLHWVIIYEINHVFKNYSVIINEYNEYLSKININIRLKRF